MGDSAHKETPKIKFFDGVKVELKKISWPERQSLFKQSVAVVSVSVVVGLIIALFDTIIKYGINFLTM